MAQRFVYNSTSTPSLASHNLTQFADEFVAASIPGTESQPDLINSRFQRATYSITGDGVTLSVVVEDVVSKRAVDDVVVAHVSDENYGVFVPTTETDIMAMTFEQLRSFVAARMGDSDNPQ